MFRSVTTDLGHTCLWLDPDAGRKDLGVNGGQLASLIMIHGGALLFDVNGLLDFMSVPLLFSAYHYPVVRSRLISALQVLYGVLRI